MTRNAPPSILFAAGELVSVERCSRFHRFVRVFSHRSYKPTVFVDWPHVVHIGQVVQEAKTTSNGAASIGQPRTRCT